MVLGNGYFSGSRGKEAHIWSFSDIHVWHKKEQQFLVPESLPFGSLQTIRLLKGADFWLNLGCFSGTKLIIVWV